MSSNLLQSTEVSTTVQTVQNSTKADLSYEPKAPWPEMFAGVPNRVQPYNSPANLFGNYLMYQIPKTGSLIDSLIRLDFTYAATAGVGAVFPADWNSLDLIDRFEFRTSSQLLQTIHGHALRDRVKTMPLNKKMSILKNTRLRVASTDALIPAAVTVNVLALINFLTLSFPLLTLLSEKGNLLETLRVYLPKTEQLYMYVYFNSAVKARFTADGADAATLTPVSSYLFMNTLTLAQQTQNEIIAKNMSSSGDVNKNIILGYDYQRFTAVCSSVTDPEITHNIVQFIRRSWISIHPLNSDGTYASCKILSLDFDLNGTKLVDNFRANELNYLSEQNENCNSLTLAPFTHTLAYDEVQSICINWAVMPEMYDLFSGGVSFAQIPNIKITAHCTNLGVAANYELVIVHETIPFISISDQGLLSISSFT